jgi:ribosomal protein L32
MDYEDVERMTGQNQGELVELKAFVRQLQARVDRQALVIKTLQGILLAHAGVTEDQFLARLQQAIAAHAATNPNVCRKCGKAISPKHAKCMYCGEPRATDLV